VSSSGMIGLSEQKKAVFVPFVGFLIVGYSYMNNTRYLASHGVSLGPLRIKSTLGVFIVFSVCLIPDQLYQATLRAIFGTDSQFGIANVLSLIGSCLFCYAMGFMLIWIQKMWGVSENGGEEIQIPDTSNGQPASTFLGVRLTDITSESYERVYSLSSQRTALLVPFVNFCLVFAMAMANTRYLTETAIAQGKKTPQVFINLAIRTTLFGILLTGYLLLLDTIGFLDSNPWPSLLGLYLCTLAMGFSFISYQKKLGVSW